MQWVERNREHLFRFCWQTKSHWKIKCIPSSEKIKYISFTHPVWNGPNGLFNYFISHSINIKFKDKDYIYKENLLLMVSLSSNTSKLFTWTSTISVDSIFLSSLYGTFCNLFRRVVFPAPAHPSIMHLTWRTVRSPLPRNSLIFFSSSSISKVKHYYYN